MRYKRNKRKKQLVKPIITLILLAIALTTYIVAINTPDKQPERPLKVDTEYKTYEYVITEIKGNEVFGKSTLDDTGIYFTSNELDGIEVNDRILAFFEPENLVEMVKVEKVNE